MKAMNQYCLAALKNSERTGEITLEQQFLRCQKYKGEGYRNNQNKQTSIHTLDSHKVHKKLHSFCESLVTTQRVQDTTCSIIRYTIMVEYIKNNNYNNHCSGVYTEYQANQIQCWRLLQDPIYFNDIKYGIERMGSPK